MSPQRPVIGLAGFFGYGNYGDELFLEVFKEHLGDAFNFMLLSDIPEKPYFSEPPEDRVAQVDAILIGGGDLITPWVYEDRYFHPAYLAKPVFIIGIGVPVRSKTIQNSRAKSTSLTDKKSILSTILRKILFSHPSPTKFPRPQVENEKCTIRFKEFFQHPNVRLINARDAESVDWIQTKLRPTIPVNESPDLVCALTLPPAQRKSKTLGIVTRQRKGYEDYYGVLSALGTTAHSSGWRVRHIILGTGKVGERDFADSSRLIIPEKEVIYTQDIQALTRSIGECDVFASMKFHGSVVATMYGIPSFVLIPTSKNRNFMKRIGRTDLLSRFDDVGLPDRFLEGPDKISDNSLEVLRSHSRSTLLHAKKAMIEALDISTH